MIKKRSWHIFITAIGICVVGYFLFHTVQGDHGWLAMLHLQQEVNTAQSNLSQLQQNRQEVEHHVRTLRPNNLDPDLLDEKSRELLDYSKPNEIVILTPSPNK